MDLFTYLMAKKGHNTHRDLFSYLLGKGAGESGTYVNFTGTSLNISNTLRARIKNITLKGATSQHTTTGKNKLPLASGSITHYTGVTNKYSTVTIEDNIIHDVGYVTEGVTGEFTTSYKISVVLGQANYGDYLPTTNLFTLPAGTYSLNYIYLSGVYSNTNVGSNNRSISIYKVVEGVRTNIGIINNLQNVNKNLLFTLEEETELYVGYGEYVASGNITTVNIDTYFKVTITPGETADYDFEEYTGGQPSPSPSYPQPIKVVTGEQNIQIGTTNYPLSLGNMELAEITENYQDYIYGTPNNWYKYKYIQKKVFNGSEEWTITIENTNTIQFKNYVIPQKAKGLYNIMSDLFKTYSGNVEEQSITGQSVDTGVQIIINKSIANTAANFKTWLSTHNVTAYYQLATPTSEQITDTTLIEQLNNLYNATSQEGTTYITCSSASDSNEIIVFSGDIKVASVGNSLNTSLLSSNIQEEPNLDDVNETEDIEQNEEPIEEEVS